MCRVCVLACLFLSCLCTRVRVCERVWVRVGVLCVNRRVLNDHVCVCVLASECRCTVASIHECF